jgi:hypothetical protein
VSALRLATPDGIRHIDLGPQRAVPPRGHTHHCRAVVPATLVLGLSGDASHQPRDWAAVKRAQRERGTC